MLFGFTTTWTLFASIALCVANYQQGSSYGEDQNYLSGNLISYEKFVEGDQFEPLLYGQYTFSESISPLYVPRNPYTESYSSVQNYQTPANGYARPMSAKFDVYTAKNPTPAQYKPAQQNYGVYQSGGPIYNSYSNQYASAASYSSSSSNYDSTSDYSSPVNNYGPNYSPKPEAHYGLNYESNNQKKIFIPTESYSPQPAYLPQVVNPSVGYYPMPQPPTTGSYRQIKGYSQTVGLAQTGGYRKLQPNQINPIISGFKKLDGTSSNHNETKSTDHKNEEKSKIEHSKPETVQIINLAAKADKSKEKTKDKKAPPPQNEPENSTIPEDKRDNIEKSSQGHENVVPLPAPQTQTRKNSTTRLERKFLGYTYIRRENQPIDLDLSRRRSASMLPNNQKPEIRNHQQPLVNRNSPVTWPIANSHEPSSNLNIDNKTVIDNNKRSYNTNQIKFLTAREDPKHSAANNIYSRSAYGIGYNYGGSYSGGYNKPYAATSSYNENHYGEAILRGYSVNQEENNNKAIVRIIEELYNGSLFEIRVCNLKKDTLYAIYIHNYGQISTGCESVGDEFGAQYTYFNPMLGVRTNPTGFIGAFKYPGESLNIQHFSKSLHFSQINGRSITIHEITTNQKILPEAVQNNMLNNFSMLMNPLSSPLVTSKKVACGVIGVANPYSFLRPPNPTCDIEVPVTEGQTAEATPTRRETKEEDSDKQKKKNDLKTEKQNDQA